MASQKQSYKVQWTHPANISFSAASHSGIIREVKTIARQTGRLNDRCMVFSKSGQVVLEGVPSQL